MLDRRRKDLPRLVQIAASVEHVVDLGPVFRPFLDRVEIAVVRDQRVAGFLFGLGRPWIVLGRQAFSIPLLSGDVLVVKRLRWPRQVRKVPFRL